MDLSIEVRLKDHEENTIRVTGFKIDAEAKMEKLREEIGSIFRVDSTNLQFFFNGVELGFRGTLKDAKITDESTIVVKHRLLPQWERWLKCVDELVETKDTKEEKRLHQECKVLQEMSFGSDFILLYPKFGDERNNLVERSNLIFLDRTQKQIQDSARTYFQSFYGNNATIDFDRRWAGSRHGTICLVTMNGRTIKYFIKAQHAAGDRDASCFARQNPDLKELFVYKFLRELGIGAEVVFINDAYESRIYIVSREIINFETIEEIEANRPDDLADHKEAVSLMLTVYSVLDLGDHHNENLGLDNKGHPFIVDFFMRSRKSFDLKDPDNFYGRIKEGTRINEALASLTLEERVGMARKYLDVSDFVAKLAKTREEFLDKESEHWTLLAGLCFEPIEKKTEDLKAYIDKVKENVVKLYNFDLGK